MNKTIWGTIAVLSAFIPTVSLAKVGSMEVIKPRTSQLELYVRLSPHTAPELLGD